VLVGVVVGALVVGTLWLAVAKLGAPAPEQVSATTPGSSPTVLGTEAAARASARPASSPPPATALEKCAALARARTRTLTAAEPAMDQWRVHIGAMNKLVTGAITLQQANDFWNQTRVAAARKLRTFHAADRRLRALDLRCDVPTRAAGATHPVLAGCAQAVAEQRRAVAATRAALHTWGAHVQDMEMLRMGHLSAAQATEMWLRSWHQGVDELRRYDRVDRATAERPVCA
jgi:hypothetical protein